jgi:hypothetical protein
MSILSGKIGWRYCKGHSPRQKKWSRVLDRGSRADMDGHRLPIGRDGVGQGLERVRLLER